jgi:hypothetical protein
MFKESRALIHPTATLLADSGYQGLVTSHPNSQIPVKKSPNNRYRWLIKNTTDNSLLFVARLSILIDVVRFFE